jgi:hypothetical protein
MLRCRWKQEQTLVAWVEAYVLGSNCDALLRIVDSAGRVLSFNHDGRNLILSLRDASRWNVHRAAWLSLTPPDRRAIHGGEGCVYRLHLTAGPFVPLPPAHRAKWNKERAPISRLESDGNGRGIRRHSDLRGRRRGARGNV